METPQRREFQQGMNHATGSYELVVSPVILALLGLWLDRTIDTTPLFTVVFAVIGLIGASVKIYFGYMAEMDEHEVGKPWAKPS